MACFVSSGRSCSLLNASGSRSISKRECKAFPTTTIGQTKFAGLSLQNHIKFPKNDDTVGGHQRRYTIVAAERPYAGQHLLRTPLQVDQWVQNNQNDTHVANLFRQRLAGRPSVQWIGDWIPDPYPTTKNFAEQALRSNSLYQICIYNIPGRDAGNYSAGGARNADEYMRWIDSAANGLRGAGTGIIILEPDALPLIDAIREEERKDERYQLLSYAVDKFELVGANVYIDIGHPRWLDPDEAARRLKLANVGRATGFCMNVSNMIGTEECERYGNKINDKLDRKKGFVIDTSRNGAGPPEGATGEDAWCNVPSARLGRDPSTDPGGNEYLHAYMWVKVSFSVP